MQEMLGAGACCVWQRFFNKSRKTKWIK